MTTAAHTPSAPSSRNVARLDSLTGLRFAAALAVFAHHITMLLPETGFRHIESTLRVGPTGVSFFFVLSGFVLLWSRRDGDTSGAFLQRRIASRTGHLSNRASAELTRDLVHRDLAHVILAHLSEQCNDHGIAHATTADALRRTQFRGTLSVAMQHGVVGPYRPRAGRAEPAAQYALGL